MPKNFYIDNFGRFAVILWISLPKKKLQNQKEKTIRPNLLNQKGKPSLYIFI